MGSKYEPTVKTYTTAGQGYPTSAQIAEPSTNQGYTYSYTPNYATGSEQQQTQFSYKSSAPYSSIGKVGGTSGESASQIALGNNHRTLFDGYARGPTTVDNGYTTQTYQYNEKFETSQVTRQL